MRIPYASFSADGQWIVFQSRRQGTNRLQAFNITAGEIIDLSPSSGGAKINERHPAIIRSEDHKLTIVFGSGFEPDGKGLERLKIRQWPSMKTDDLLGNAELGGAIPAVLDGHIYFAGFGRTGSARVPDLMMIEAQGKTPVRLTQTKFEEWRPAPAADGTVFFIANPRGQFDIFALAPGSDEPQRVFGSDADEWDPAVSPDSRWLTFASKASGHWNLMLLDRKSGTGRAITTGTQDDWDPEFHPDGKFITFGRSTGAEPEIFGVCAFGETQER